MMKRHRTRLLFGLAAALMCLADGGGAVAGEYAPVVGHDAARVDADAGGSPRPGNMYEMLEDRIAGLRRAAPKGWAFERIGESVEGRPLHAIVVPAFGDGGRGMGPIKLLLVGQQHGDEVAGMYAIVAMLEDLAAGDASVADGLSGVEVHAIPMLNPDGAARNLRRNANAFDLNRDHTLLSQPETRALHAYARRSRPDIAIDCHEFTRDSRDYKERGWGEWPLIMLGVNNHPLLAEQGYAAAGHAADEATMYVRAMGFNACRYVLGDPPNTPGGEMRFSTLDADDCRNALAFYGGACYIIESGVKRSADDPQADLPQRVAAYRALIDAVARLESSRHAAEVAKRSASDLALPLRIPTNFFWARTGDAGGLTWPVIDLAARETVYVDSPNRMTERVIKSFGLMANGYAVPGDRPEAVERYRDLLDAHGIAYRELTEPEAHRIQRVRLLRVEEDYDAVYHRYGGRQITRVLEAEPAELSAGSLVVDLIAIADGDGAHGNIDARRAIAHLEPLMLFGLYQWPAFRELVDDGEVMPIVRLLPESRRRSPAPAATSSVGDR